MTDTSNTPVITMANTKKEMLDAYTTMKKQLETRSKELLNAEKARKEMEKKAAEAVADIQASQDPLLRLSSLRSDISKELTTLGQRFEEELDAYSKIKTAIKAKQEELDTIYGVETAASDLAALIEAQQAKRDDFEREMTERRDALETEVEETTAAWEKERERHDREEKERAENLKRQRQREKEEFEYGFAREKAQRKNALEDELKAVEKEIEKKRQDFDQEAGRRKNDLDVREAEIIRQETEIAALKNAAEAFPRRMDEAVANAVKDTTARLTGDFEKDNALMASRFDGEKNVLASKIESLEKLVQNQSKQIADLVTGHDQAYEKVQEIANRAISAAKREIISVPVSASRSSSSTNEE